MSKKPDSRFPKVIEVVVEIPAGSRNKYEFDEAERRYLASTACCLSASSTTSTTATSQDTRAGDGDHTDAIVLLAEPTFPGCHMWARPVGGLRMSDEKGDDFKVLCVALGDPLWSHVKRLDQCRPHRLREIEHFFATYKLLEDKSVDVDGWADADRRPRGPARGPSSAGCGDRRRG